MFTIDEKIRGLPATPDQVIALYQSLNAPHVAIPGKRAGPAKAYILGIRMTGGFAVFIYLFLAEVGDCAIYASQRRTVSTPEDFRGEESEAFAFVESMGFMMDNLNFRQLPADRQTELIRTLPPFQKDPQAALAASRQGAQKADPTVALGRLFSSF